MRNKIEPPNYPLKVSNQLIARPRGKKKDAQRCIQLAYLEHLGQGEFQEGYIFTSNDHTLANLIYIQKKFDPSTSCAN